MNEYDKCLDYLKTGNTYGMHKKTLAFYDTKPTREQLTAFRNKVKYIINVSYFVGIIVGFGIGILISASFGVI